MDLLKEALEPGWITVQITSAATVRALSLDDTVGLKARALHDRFVIRDIIDLHAVADTFSYIDLENLARRHDPALDLEAILDHLAGWYDDLARRLAAECTDDDLPDDL